MRACCRALIWHLSRRGKTTWPARDQFVRWPFCSLIAWFMCGSGLHLTTSRAYGKPCVVFIWMMVSRFPECGANPGCKHALSRS